MLLPLLEMASAAHGKHSRNRSLDGRGLDQQTRSAVDRDKAGVILRNATMGIGFDALGNLFQVFWARQITRKH